MRLSRWVAILLVFAVACAPAAAFAAAAGAQLPGPAAGSLRPAPVITVTAPAGGEKWQTGSRHDIALAYAGNVGKTLKITLHKVSAGEAYDMTIAAGFPLNPDTPGKGVCADWTIPAQVPAGDYQIIIASNEAAGVKGTSATFGIAAAELSANKTLGAALPGQTVIRELTKQVFITSPRAGDVWQDESPAKIEWTYLPKCPAEYVKIVLMAGDKERVITGRTGIGQNGKGSYSHNFTKYPAKPGDELRIKLIGVNIAGEPISQEPLDVSASFTLGDTAKVTLLTPAGGDTIRTGQHVKISWSYSGNVGDSLRLELYNVAQNWREAIESKAPPGAGGQGSYDWVPGDYLPAGNAYRVGVYIDPAYSHQASFSGNFTITPGPKELTIVGQRPGEPPAIKLITPHARTLWQMKVDQRIAWSYPADCPVHALKVLLLKGGTVLKTVNPRTSIGEDGKGEILMYQWDSVTPGNDYRVRLVGVTLAGDDYSGAPQYTSERFVIAGSPGITVTAPAAGQVVHVGQTVKITWDYSGKLGDKVNIRLGNADASWGDEIALQAPPGAAGHGSYDWVVDDKYPPGSYYVSISSVVSQYADVVWGTSGKFQIAK